MTLRDLYGAPWGTTGPAPIREPQARLREIRDETGRNRRHRLRQHQLGLSQRGEEIPDPRHRRPVGRSIPRPPRRARPNSAFRRAPSTRFSPTRPSRSFSTSRCRRRMSKSACRRSPPASTSIRKSRLASALAEAARSDRRGRGEGTARRLRARHVPRRRAADRRKLHRRRARSAGRSAARPSSCARATSAGIPIPASTISPAAVRCSTWAPITSPLSSICSVRWRASAAWRRACGLSASITSQPLDGNAHSGRGRDPCHRHAGVRERRGGFDDDELRRAAAQTCSDRALRRNGLADRARPQLFRRRRSNSRRASEDWRVIADAARLCRRQLPHPRRRRHGACDPHRPAAPRERRAGPACAGSDGGVPDLVRRRRGDRHLNPPRAAGADAGSLATANSTEAQATERARQATENGGSCDARSADRLGRLERPRAGSRARISSRACSRSKASRSISRTPPRPSPIRRSPT